MALGSIYNKLKTTIDGAVAGAQNRQQAAVGGNATPANQAIASMLPPSMQNALGAMNQAGQASAANLQQIQQAPAQAAAAAAAAAAAEKEKLDKLNAPAYQDVSQTYGKAQADAANKTATEATKGQSYEAITSPFASAGAYTKANASRTGQVLQQLYSGNASTKTTKGEAGLSAQLAAQGGAAFGEDQEKALKDNAQKAYEATNPDKVAEKLLGNMNSVPQGTDLNYQLQSMIAPDVAAAERMDRQARVNEALRTGQSEVLAAENQMALSNPKYREGIKSYITDTSKAALEAAKGTSQKNKEAAEGKVAAAKAEADKAGTDATVVSQINTVERALGRSLTGPNGTISEEYVGELVGRAQKDIPSKQAELAKLKKRSGMVYRDGRWLNIFDKKAAARANQLTADIDSLNKFLSGANSPGGYLQGTRKEVSAAQSELDKIASQYRRFS